MPRTITGIADPTLKRTEPQHEAHLLGEGRSVMLDVWGTDGTGAIYDLGVQRSIAGASPRRARYHGVAMDVAALPSGEDFEALPERHVIFVTERDAFGDGAGLHHFERVEAETGLALGDGTHVLCANAAYVATTGSARSCATCASAILRGWQTACSPSGRPGSRASLRGWYR